MKMRIGPRACGLSVALLLHALAASPASAVPLSSMAVLATKAVDGDYTPVVLVRDLPLLERALRLDEGQREILLALSADLATDTPGRETSLAFLDSLRAILTDEQLALIPDAIREIRRDRMHTSAGIAGERIDVGMVAKRHLRGISSESATQCIERYWRELDLLLAAREAAEPQMRTNADRDSARRAATARANRTVIGAVEARELLQARILIRELNDLTITELSASMPEALAGEFELNALAEAYPNAYVPSGTLEHLRAIASEHPSPAFLALRDEAVQRLDVLRRKAVDAIRKRDAAPLSGGGAQVEADKLITKCELEYADFESWLLEAITAAESPEQLGKIAAGRALLERAKVAEMSANHDWDNQQATVARFDLDGDGQLSGDESSQILDAFVRNVGRRSRWRL